ncbi:MAG: hydrogenase nickel incorporation protein HypB [Anaerohalosphaeraceae bacterium]|nr:hydrogenase nickel incorporation protein HypB [Anaerohalosphaeraceae bacterium]
MTKILFRRLTSLGFYTIVDGIKMKVRIEKKILESNDACAAAARSFFEKNSIGCVNIISSPGSGKTTILARTVRELKGKMNIAVIEGDLETDRDAKRIQAEGAQAVQIETRGACHLTARQVTESVHSLELAGLDLIVIENVGNLVCPSDFDLGEGKRVVVLSTPEGDDKCAKYSKAFVKADVLLLNKTDIAELLEFDFDRVKAEALKLNKDLKIFEISAKTGDGMQGWYDWLAENFKS